MFDLSFDPLIPTSLWLTLALVGVATLLWYASTKPAAIARMRWRVSLALMSLGLLLVLGLLLNPTHQRELPPPPGKPVLTVLVDASSSMATPDVGEKTTRFAAAGAMVRRVASDLEDRFDVKIKAFDREIRTASADLHMEPGGASTDVAGAMSSSLSGDVAAGEAIVLLSDGIHNTGGGGAKVLEAVRVAKAMDIPVYTRTFGGGAERMDLAIEMKSPADLAIVGQRLPVSARITQEGLRGARANVVLLENGTEVARRVADLSTSMSADVHFQIVQDKPGVYPYELRVESAAGESVQANNSCSYVLRVVDEPVRVLMLEGKPYWDSKFFTRSLVTDPAVALDCVVKLTDSRLMRRVLTHKKLEGDAKAPVNSDAQRDDAWQIVGDASQFLASRDKLRGYQVIVLGRDSESFLSPAAIENLQDWVAEEGGSLVCYRGTPTAPANQPLAKILPVKWSNSTGKPSRFRVALTDRGEELGWFQEGEGSVASVSLTGMPSLTRTSEVEKTKPLTVILAKGSGSDRDTPLLSYQPYGAGRVVAIEGSGMWRWAFLPPQYQKQQQVYASLWHSMMRWLTSNGNLQPGQQFGLREDKSRFGIAENATVTLLAREDVSAAKLPQVELVEDREGAEAKSYRPTPVGDEAGVFRVTFGQLSEGRYRARIAGAKPNDPSTQVAFEVRKYEQEQLDLQARPDLMARIATESGGAVLNDDDANAITKHFKEHQARNRPPQIEKTVAWDRWWLLVMVMGVWAAAWSLRRSGGLI